ncbi:BigA/YdbA N-terminal beta-barrel domain-containing protein [Citrobacter braakii]|uniref:BigA/YdbA N-terminal beta-barrel domain-containing protein n=1 Tax=Citrobacter braakii TaxID=57706 RepID=UPI00190502AA|nr:autotransporter domain-containing protein [Citrobacter braakii]MBJ9241148.1 autotransporter domain-containing protein [Citrobacter braakii]
MQRKAISFCIALALSGNTFAADLNHNEDKKKQCPANISSLSQAELAKLSPECQKATESVLEQSWAWAVGGIAAVAATVGIAASGGGSGNSSHNNPPVDPVDPVGPVDPVDPVTPVDPVKPDASITVYDNGVTLDRGAKTLTFASLVVNGVTYTNATFTMTKQGDGYLLTAPDGKTLTVTSLNVEGNVLVMQGTYGSNNLFWSYTRAGKLTLAGPDTTVIDGDGQQKTIDGGSSADGAGGTGTIINGDDNKIINGGDNSGTNGGTGTKVDGNDNTIDNGGKNTADGADSRGTDVDGNGNAINNGGENSGANGGTGTDVTGDTNTIDNKGNNSGTDGGTGTKVDGNGNTIDNKGTNTADGTGSKGTDVDGNGNAINNGGENSGANGGTGTDVTGDTNTIDNKGNNSGTDGGTGTKVDGNGNTIDNKGTNTADGKDSSGTDVTGDNNKINNEGETSANNGGTGTKVDGDGNAINNNGSTTAEGSGSTGTDVNGNGNDINNNGDNTATNGGTGTKVDGNENTVDNKGKTTADGEDSTGTDVNGDNNKINNEGETSASNGGTGTKVDGNGNTIDNKGATTAEGAGSTGTDVAGNNNIINSDGASKVVDGATGAKVSGDDNTLNNAGEMTASSTDSTKPSVGVDVAGNNNTVNQNGKMVVGDYATGLNVTGKSNTINLASEEMKITGQQATGVNVSGEANTVTLTGNMVVDKDQKSPLAAENFFTPSTGINVNGNGNTVVLDGHLQVIADTEVTSRKYGGISGSQESIQGLVVSGDNNRVNLLGGVILTGENDQVADTAAGDALANQRKSASSPLISIDGKSSVYISGDSRIEGEFGSGTTSMFWLSNGAYMELTDGATFTTNDASIDRYWNDHVDSSLVTVLSGATFTNKGEITVSDNSLVYAEGAGTSAVNDKTIEVNRTSAASSTTTDNLMAFYVETGAVATNNGRITGKVLNQDGIFNYRSVVSTQAMLINNSVTSLNMMVAGYAGARAINNATGEIDVYGRGIAMAAFDNAYADNFGKITTDAMWKSADDTTELPANVPSSSARDYSVGMAVGTDTMSGAKTNAIATNHQGGTITINNAGAGMVAYGATNQVINQGTINLEQNENYDATKPLVGMAVYAGGTAINDTTGVININAENGQAFYSDGNANNRIVNRGQIILGANASAEADNSATSTTPELADGTILTDTTTLSGSTSILSGSTVSNTGTVDGISALIVEGIYNNQTGAVTSAPLTVNAGGVVNNSGTLSGKTTVSGKMVNTGSMNRGAEMNGSGKVSNNGTATLGSSADATNASKLDLKNNSVFDNLSGGTLILDNNKNGIHVNNDSTLKNEKGGTITVTNSSTGAGINIWGGTADFINDGTATATGKTLVGSSSDAAAGKAFAWNQDDGVINFAATASGQSAVSLTNSNYVGINDGTMNISGSGAIGMKGSKNAQLVNNGTINLGTTGTADTGMIAMQLDASATADAVIENNGAINIYAKDSYAFSRLGANGRIINNGTVLLEGTGSGLVKESGVTLEGNGTGGNGTETHAASYTLPVDPTAVVQSNGLRSSINQYTIGTNASGTAGTLTADYIDLGDVDVDTGFTTGTAATTQTFNDVFVGQDIQGEQNIKSSSVVWNAQGQKDANGNVDVTMTKNAYTDVVSDSGVNSVAGALDAAYTNNELFSSLNLKTSADVTKAMKQISGSKAVNVSRDARRLSNRFDMLADAAPEMGNGLAFNLVAKGDKRAELGKDTQYDMMALRQKLGFGDNQSLTMEYGIARLDGKGNVSSGSNGITGGYSQFLGLEHAMPLGEEGLSWNNALRYDVHQLDSKRGINYGDVNKQALADSRQQYLELRTEGRKTFAVSEGLDVVPYAGLKLRHTLEDGYQERGAGDFNLNMNSSTETAVDSVVGMKLSYAGKDGWAATATLEGGPNLSYVSTGKKASLQGAAGQSFNVDDGQKGGSINSMAQVGVKYNAGNTSAGLDAFHWKEDSISDKGFMLNVKHNF